MSVWLMNIPPEQWMLQLPQSYKVLGGCFKVYCYLCTACQFIRIASMLVGFWFQFSYNHIILLGPIRIQFPEVNSFLEFTLKHCMLYLNWWMDGEVRKDLQQIIRKIFRNNFRPQQSCSDKTTFNKRSKPASLFLHFPHSDVSAGWKHPIILSEWQWTKTWIRLGWKLQYKQPDECQRHGPVRTGWSVFAQD